MTPKVSKELFACSGLDLATEITRAGESGFAGEPLAGLSANATFDVAVQKLVTHNVVARIPGAKYPGEYFAYTAHWDHLGRGKPDRTGDDIYNGALDNAGGVAGLLELARAFGRGPRPQRSILFIAMTLEESGLLGSEYFASHPLVPLEKVAGGFNMDAINLFGETGTMEVTSIGQTTLEDHLKAELAKQGREMKDDPNSVVGFYYRSDHFPFAKRGVPFIFAGSGWELAEKTAPNTREPEVGTRLPPAVGRMVARPRLQSGRARRRALLSGRQRHRQLARMAALEPGHRIQDCARGKRRAEAITQARIAGDQN